MTAPTHSHSRSVSDAPSVETSRGFFGRMFDTVKSTFGSAVDAVKSAFTWAADSAKSAANWTVKSVKGAFSWAKDTVVSAFDWVIASAKSAFNWVKDSASSLGSRFVNLFKKKTVDATEEANTKLAKEANYCVDKNSDNVVAFEKTPAPVLLSTSTDPKAKADATATPEANIGSRRNSSIVSL